MDEEDAINDFLGAIIESYDISGETIKEVFLKCFTRTSDDEYEKKIKTNKQIADEIGYTEGAIGDFLTDIYKALSRESKEFGQFKVISDNSKGPGKRLKVYTHLWGTLYPEWCTKHGKKVCSPEDLGLINCHIQSRNILPLVGKSILSAQKEMWFFGTNFCITLPDQKDIIIERLQANKELVIYFLVFNHIDNVLGELAKDFNQTEEELKEECVVGLQSLLELREQFLADSKSRDVGNRFKIRLSDSFPRMRAYIFDPDNENQYSIFIPYINQIDSPNLPAYLSKNVANGITQAYFDGIKKQWSKSIPLE